MEEVKAVDRAEAVGVAPPAPPMEEAAVAESAVEAVEVGEQVTTAPV